MVRASKTPVATSPAPAPVAAEPKKASATKKAAAPKSADAAPTKASKEVAVVVSADAPANEVLPADDLVELLSSFSTKVNELSVFYSAFKALYKLLQKAVLKEHKTAQKVSNRKNKRSGNRKPSGFVRPTMISPELATFLGKPAGTEMARTDVSREINSYIRSHSLQDKANGRKIIPDAKLAALLKTQPIDELTYFNLQRYMKHHFVKVEAPATA